MKESLGDKTVLPTPVWVVGTYDGVGKPNVMTAAWAGICCSDPPAVMVALRKATYTYGSIIARKAFTVSVPSEKYVKEVDYFGMASGTEADKLAVAGLTPAKSDLVDAPYVDEFPLIVECRLIHNFEIGLHTMFVGEIADVKAEESILSSTDMFDIARLKPFFFVAGNSKYYGIGPELAKAFETGADLRA
jgi:flavin reductase (DIM6/NTAB) family NADH-FMN oxidoreductase RutF